MQILLYFNELRSFDTTPLEFDDDSLTISQYMALDVRHWRHIKMQILGKILEICKAF